MPVTAADVRNVAFSKPPIGKRGYHEDEVDAFLDVVGAELARLSAENNDLRNQVAQLEQRQRAAPVDTGANLRPLQPPGPVMTSIPPQRTEQTSPGGDHHVQAAKVLGLAQEIADRLTLEAKADADAMLSKARTTSEHLLRQATAKADGMVTEARARAETLLTDARSRAETLERQSREKAASLVRDAARQHTEIIGSISQEKNILEKKVADLRAFEHQYRTRLVTYLDSQLRELEGSGSALPPDPMPSQQGFVASGFDTRAEPGSPHHDPKIGAADADAARLSAWTGPSGIGSSDEPGTSGSRWKPAVEPGVTEPWAAAQRSVS
ncbi:MAG: DivIVA domain-containing protein [Pseudonocardiaceae bacterium]